MAILRDVRPASKRVEDDGSQVPITRSSVEPGWRTACRRTTSRRPGRRRGENEYHILPPKTVDLENDMLALETSNHLMDAPRTIVAEAAPTTP